ncbi:MAG: hypothetical protein WBE97_05770 [Candidatus Acidiferrales bacterium]
MTLLHRLLCTGCFAAAFTPSIPAQTPPGNGALPTENIMQSWLQSGNPRLEAWGAHDALVASDQAVVPALLDLASRWVPISPQAPGDSPQPQLSSDQKDSRDAMAAILDALIQMNVTVPGNTLRTLAPDFGNAVAILLTRLPDEESSPLALDFVRSPPEHGFDLQYVSASLLSLHPPFGFAGELLASIRVHATVYVVPPGDKGFSGGSGSSCGAFIDQPRPDWPTTGQYALSKQKSDGAFLVVAGIDPIYAIRQQSTHYLGDSCGLSTGVYLGPSERLRLIAEVLDVSPESIAWQTSVVKTIEFQSSQQFHDALLAFVEEQQQKYRATATALWNHRLSTFTDAQDSLPELDLELKDMRPQGGDPLVRLVTLPPRVEWTPSPR